MNDFRFEEKMSKIRAAGEDVALSLIYQWVKTGAINLRQMKALVKDVMNKSPFPLTGHERGYSALCFECASKRGVSDEWFAVRGDSVNERHCDACDRVRHCVILPNP
jgi:hypothetical protein